MAATGPGGRAGAPDHAVRSRCTGADRVGPDDRVTRLRSNTPYFSDVEDLAALDKNGLNVPTFCESRGYQDRFVFGRSNWMDFSPNKPGQRLGS